MRNFVVLTLVAPMGAFGDLAGHERRGSWHWPGRSALLGLLGAALGVRRDDRAGQEALAIWQTAVEVLKIGPHWRDFHTVQTVPSTRIKRPATRRKALAALQPKDNALITRRDYHSDCAFAVALWTKEESDEDAAALCKALKRPAFIPYLGRKSCPLSAPMAPQQVQAEDVPAALAQFKLPDFLPTPEPETERLIASDEDLGDGRQETRWDTPLDRKKWHFSQRRVYLT
ncbi:MAG: type I-E CRISPR-associated protein Cas5/CasD [Cellvibrionales bacterium]|nr:type I-E CRISPR-associated protein Cas5/CasD [Cellvibrionales bacterium]